MQGEVRNFTTRTETAAGRSKNPFAPMTSQETIWDFRLERYDENGNRLPPIPVQMRGESFSGSIQDGDTVRLVENAWDGRNTVNTDSVFNVTLNTPVTTIGGGSNPMITIVMTVFLLAFLGFVIFIIYRFFISWTPPF
jgi:hypothetical protein